MQPIKLCPAQQQVFDGMIGALPAGNVFWLWGGPGSGKSTMLSEIHHTLGGALLTVKDYVDALRGRHPLTIEETFSQLVMEALHTHEHVILDDLDVLENATQGHMYPRRGFLDAPLRMITSYAIDAGKKLIVTGGQCTAVRRRGYPFGIQAFTAADYASLCTVYLGPALAGGLDFVKIHRFAPNLNAYQLKTSCHWLKRADGLDTQRFIEHLQAQHMVSNVELEEVQPVDLHDLKGIDDLIQALEANIILPLENEELAAELQLSPKRGVLLAGPPGTGKTTVGRALAHRLRGRFFLVDGSFISGTPQFYMQIQRVVEAAKQNGTCILFIDDSDVIFESGSETGLYRYLLTMLDRLESKSAGRICVMLTAMDVANLPPALLRSGRIELWLETRLPDEVARRAILEDHLAGVAATMGSVDRDQFGAATEGLSGADLKRLVEDGKILYAYDKAEGRLLRPPTDYFLTAVETVRGNKERYAQADARARSQRPQRPSWFMPSEDVAEVIMGSVQEVMLQANPPSLA